MCERFCGCWGVKLYALSRATFPSSPPSAREWRNTRTPLQGRTGEPRGLTGERAGRTWQQHPHTPSEPDSGSIGLESDFITPRKRGKRRLSSDSSNSEGESLDSRTPLKMTRVGEDVMADTATTPPASPTVPTPTLLPNRGRNTPPESLENRNNNSEASPTATPAGTNSSRVPAHRHSWTSRLLSTTSAADGPGSTSSDHGTAASCCATRWEQCASLH